MKKGFSDRGVRHETSGVDPEARPSDAQSGDEGIDEGAETLKGPERRDEDVDRRPLKPSKPGR